MTTITTRSGKGSPLTNNEVDANFTNLNDDKVEASGDSMTGDLSFGDNNKVILGSGNDLQLYHDGTDSIINEGTAGNLLVQGATIKLQTANGAKDYLVATPSAEITLYHNNAAKLATTSTGIDVTGTITFDGGTTTADVNFGDNDKAIFGAGSDLQIYHNGSNSYIDDAGTGSLVIRSSQVNIGKYTGETAAVFTADGSVQLRYDNSAKFETTNTGIDVTGTVTADGLTVDGATGEFKGSGANTTYFTGGDDSVAGRQLTLSSEANGGQNNATHRLTVPSGYGSFNVSVGGSERFKINNNGDISFYEDTGTTAKLFWDASEEKLGIGTTSSIDQKLTLVDTADVGIKMLKTGSITTTVRAVGGGMAFGVDGGSGTTERMRIDSSGNVLVGTTTHRNFSGGTTEITVGTSTTGATAGGAVTFGSGSGFLGYVAFQESEGTLGTLTSVPLLLKTGNTERMRIDSSGNVGIGTSSPERLLHVDSGGTIVGALIQNTSAVASRLGLMDANTTNSARVGVGATGDTLGLYSGGAARATLDASGNLLVSKSTSALGTVGVEAKADGQLWATRDAGVALSLNRNTSDGTMLAFYRGGSPIGAIDGVSSDLEIHSTATDHVGLRFGNGAIFPTNNSGVVTNGAANLGASTIRFKDLYLSGGAYLGGTGSANHLDDYEEGTFTPTLTDGTASNAATGGTASGRYTKIGRMVHAYIVILNKNTSGLSSGQDVFIRGLPFTAFGSGVTYPQGAIKTHKITFSDYVTAQVFQAESYLKINESASNLAADFITVGEVTSGDFEILVSISYEAA